MATAMTQPAPATQGSTADKLARFLSAYWLRPENAFWMTLRSDALDPIPLDPPIIDVSCGDGLFSFLHAGGAFHEDFDVYHRVTNLERATTRHTDIYDCSADGYCPDIARSPDCRITVGTDWKRNLLDKAATLDFYDTLVQQDNNRPLRFEAGSFTTVYCNAAYWVERIDTFLRELHRITAPSGRVVLQVKLACIADYTLRAHRDRLGTPWLDLIGRGRIESWPSLADRGTWERRFARAGLAVEQTVPFVTRTHAHVWDIGLRPVAPMLIRMANELTPRTRRRVKREWVELFQEILAPFCASSFDLFPAPSEPAEITYVLRPQ